MGRSLEAAESWRKETTERGEGSRGSPTSGLLWGGACNGVGLWGW